MRQTAVLETQMTSVERVIEYAKQPSEPPLTTDFKHRPDAEWPHQGKIEFSNFSLKYSEDGKMILNDMNLIIQPKVSKNGLSLFFPSPLRNVRNSWTLPHLRLEIQSSTTISCLTGYTC